MLEIKAVFKVITPLFMSGAERERAELRISSIKGAIRFWYRALAWSRCQPEKPCEKRLEELRRQEASLFGGVIGDERAVKSPCHLKWIQRHFDRETGRREWSAPGSAYLGFGCIGRSGGRTENVRDYIKPGSTFGLSFLFRHPIQEEQRELLLDAIRCLGLIGGLGSRSRRGFGSVALLSLQAGGNEMWKPPADLRSLETAIRSLFQGRDRPSGPLPPFTAFNGTPLFTVTDTAPDGLSLLDEMGKKMMRFRSYGMYNDVARKHILPWSRSRPFELAEQRFKDDHDLVLKAFDGPGCGVESAPRRAVFGLPHNYFFKSSKLKADIAGKDSERRASPLFIHIHELTPESYSAVVTLIPAEFLPPGERIVIKGPRGSISVLPPEDDYGVLKEFIEYC